MCVCLCVCVWRGVTVTVREGPREKEQMADWVLWFYGKR